MDIDDIVLMSFEGSVIKGHRIPSSEMHLHRLLFQRRPDIGCFIHSHSPFASAVACVGKAIPVVLEDMAQILGGEVACTAYIRAGNHEELALAACEKIGDKAMAVLLGNHGPIVGGRTLGEALIAVQVLEKAAACLIQTAALGEALVIPQESIDLERDRYLNKYGTELDASVSPRGDV
jgi:L-fuculose-phosphate aldolase